MSWDEALAAFDELAGEQPPLRHVLVPAHRPDADQAQQPARRRPLRGRAAVAASARWLDDELPVQPRLRRGATRLGNLPPRADPADQPAHRPAARERTLHRRRRTGSSPPTRTRGLPGDGVRRAARGRPGRAARGARRRSRPRDWRISFPVEIRIAPADDIPLSTAQRPRLGLPRLPHPPRRPTTRRTSAASRRSCAPTTAARTGASCTPAPPPTWRRRLPALAGLPGDARPARPGPGLHQPLPRPRCSGA